MKITKNGFTLLELLVVISIIGILSALLLANFNAARERARDTQRKGDIRNIQTALGIYYSDYGGFPTSGTGANIGKIIGCGQQTSPGPFVCEYGSSWNPEQGKVLMSTLPKDPLSIQTYYYTQTNLDTYSLQACLENKSDDKAVNDPNASWCPSKYVYTVRP